MICRPARSSDMDTIYLMGFDTWGVGSTKQTYLDECRISTKYQQGQWYCLESNGALLSSLIIYKKCFNLQAGFAGFGSISTDPQQRRKGYASELITASVDNLTLEGFVGVYLHSETNSSIYEPLGFEVVSTIKNVDLMFLGIRDEQQDSAPTYF